MNGTDKEQVLNLAPYKESLSSQQATDFLTGKTVNLVDKLSLQSRETLILCF